MCGNRCHRLAVGMSLKVKISLLYVHRIVFIHQHLFVLFVIYSVPPPGGYTTLLSGRCLLARNTGTHTSKKRFCKRQCHD